MNGILAQLLSLITYGNDSLKNGFSTTNYYPDNAAFKFCNSVNFLHFNVQQNGHSMESVVANDPIAWFNFLKEEGCLQLKAYYQPSAPNEAGTPDYRLSAFIGGGGKWFIEAIYPTYSDLWISRWEVNQPDDPDRNIWSVSYGRTVSNTDTIKFSSDIITAHKKLKSVLNDIEAFAVRHQLDDWIDVFRRAQKVLISDTPTTGFYEHLIAKTGYRQMALQLIYSAIAAHVFGGMGSWNDLSFSIEKDNKNYNDLSSSLYYTINRSLVAGVNSI